MRRPGKIFAVLFIAAGAAFLGLLGGGEHRAVRAGGDPMAHFWPAPMPQYPGAAMRPIGDQTVGASPLKMAYFTTSDSPAKVADFYAGEWRRAGYYVSEDVTPKGGAVSGYNAADGMMHQVVMVVREGRTTVFPAIATQPVNLLDQAAAPPEVPIYPGATGMLVTGARDPIGRSHTVTYLDEGPLAANLDLLPRRDAAPRLDRRDARELVQGDRRRRADPGLHARRRRVHHQLPQDRRGAHARARHAGEAE